MRVFCYYNLHRHCFSLKALEGPSKGRVLHHASRVELSEPVFKVSQAGRARVLRERSKNVHAGVVGRLEKFEPFLETDSGALPCAPAEYGWTPVTYNPYRFDSFVTLDDETSVTHARQAVLDSRKVWARYVSLRPCEPSTPGLPV